VINKPKKGRSLPPGKEKNMKNCNIRKKAAKQAARQNRKRTYDWRNDTNRGKRAERRERREKLRQAVAERFCSEATRELLNGGCPFQGIEKISIQELQSIHPHIEKILYLPAIKRDVEKMLRAAGYRPPSQGEKA